MKTTNWRVAVWRRIGPRLISLWTLVAIVFGSASAYADGCFVWKKEKDINEPTQKAIILHDQNREDLILQVKYEGAAEEFGWLIPVPGQPEVRKGTMEAFYELSQITQRHFWNSYGITRNMASERGGAEPVKVIEVKTVGAYEIAVLSSTNSSALAEWLSANQFNFPKEKRHVLDDYVRRHWFFIAIRIDPEGSGWEYKSGVLKPAKISDSIRKELANGELHPISISFPSEKCVFPLAISSVNGKASEISLYVLSANPLASRVVLERKLQVLQSEKEKSLRKWEELRNYTQEQSATRLRSHEKEGIAEDPMDPPPPSVFDLPGFGSPDDRFGYYPGPEEEYYRWPALVQSMPVNGDSEEVKECRRDSPRMKGKGWWLTKLVETFQPAEMVDLEFEPAIPLLAEKIWRESGEAAAYGLPQYGESAVKIVLDALTESQATVRRRALLAAGEMKDPRFVAPLLELMHDHDPKIRLGACYASENNFDPKFVEPLLRLLHGPGPAIANEAERCLWKHRNEFSIDASVLERMLKEDGYPSMFALQIMRSHDREIPRERLVRLLGNTNYYTVSISFNILRNDIKVDEVTPLMTNPLPMARYLALRMLDKMADKPAVDRIVSMLHDPNDGIRWRVRSTLRHLTGQKLGADPGAYEKWWAENRESYNPQPIAAGRSRVSVNR
jgi:HEAT repeat protein